jgi:hypothetical protein
MTFAHNLPLPDETRACDWRADEALSEAALFRHVRSLRGVSVYRCHDGEYRVTAPQLGDGARVASWHETPDRLEAWHAADAMAAALATRHPR